MITQDNLNDFNKYCYDIQIEFNKLEYSDKTSSEWNDERKNIYRFGVVTGLYKEKDKIILMMLEKECNMELLYSLLEKEFYRSEEESKKIFKKYGKPELYTANYFTLSRTDDFYEWIKKYNYMYLELVKNESRKTQLAFVLLQLSYNEFRDIKYRCIETEQPYLDDIYNNKYGLIELNDNIIQNSSIYNRLYDKANNKTFFCLVDKNLAKLLYDFNCKGWIGKMAFRGKNDYVLDGNVRTEPLCEEVEYGRLFSWDISKLPEITKLYDYENYNNNLWIKINNNDMIFEEILEDDYKQDDKVVTNVIHLQYIFSKNEYIITHIDHEYIFYADDEYMNRKNSSMQKGKKVKTFKVDDATIPMNFECALYNRDNIQKKIPFLYYILNLYFRDHSLIREYFNLF